MHQKPIFVLGLGAPKSGTTWLHRYLSSYPHAAMGIRKEYRIWDVKYHQKTRLKFETRRLFTRQFGVIPVPSAREMIRVPMLHIDGYYERYFQKLLTDGKTLTADISPKYMTLKREEIREVVGRLETAGFDVRLVLLMRDPVERVQSGARMRIRNASPGFAGLSPEEAVRKIYQDPMVTALTSYNRTIEELDAAFPDREIHYGVFEELFQKAEVARLSAFLDLAPNYEIMEERVNVTEKTAALSDDLLETVRAHFEEVYAFCNARFPQTAELWGEVRLPASPVRETHI